MTSLRILKIGKEGNIYVSLLFLSSVFSSHLLHVIVRSQVIPDVTLELLVLRSQITLVPVDPQTYRQ